MEQIMVVAATQETAQAIAGMLEKQKLDVSIETDPLDVLELVEQKKYDAVVINTPLATEFGHELALKVQQKTASLVALMVKEEKVSALPKKIATEGILVVAKPISAQNFSTTIKTALTCQKRVERLWDDNLKLKDKLDEIKLIDRAKFALIQCLLMSEPQAHRYIEKQAMDLRMTKKEIAEDILKTYEI